METNVILTGDKVLTPQSYIGRVTRQYVDCDGIAMSVVGFNDGPSNPVWLEGKLRDFKTGSLRRLGVSQ